jgi:hypothetical protein
MTRVTLASLDPMPALRQAAEDRVDAAFNAMRAQVSHVEAAHAQKRLWAATCDPRLKPEADLRAMTVEQLAEVILTKPDELAAREARRIALKLRIRFAATPQDLDAITAGMMTA